MFLLCWFMGNSEMDFQEEKIDFPNIPRSVTRHSEKFLEEEGENNGTFSVIYCQLHSIVLIGLDPDYIIDI